MIVPLSSSLTSSRWHQVMRVIMVLMLLSALIALPAPEPGAPRVHRTLLELAGTHPLSRVQVIVQLADAHVRENLPAEVRRFGGRVVRELALIDALVADLPAYALVDLGRIPGVRWISPDAPMVDKSCADCAATSGATSAWVDAAGLRSLWGQAPTLQGQQTTVAVIDSGITAHNDLLGATGQSRVRTNVAAHRNLVLNGDFEDGLNGWQVWAGYTSAQITTDAQSGSGAMRMPPRTGSMPSGNFQRLNSFIPGTTYTFSVFGKLAGPGCANNGDVWVGVQGWANGQMWGSGHWFCDLTYTEKSLQFTVPDDTEYVELFTVNNNTANAFLLDRITVYPVQIDANGGNMLAGSIGAPGSSVSLPNLGGIDWVHWGNGSAAAVNRRSGVPQRIQMSRLGAQSPTLYAGSGSSYSWTSGTPTASGATTNGIAVAGPANGFEIRVPSGTSYRTLRVYLTLQNSELNTMGFLSDGSSLPYIDETVNTVGIAGGVRRVLMTFTFRSELDSQQLIVRFTNSIDQASNATLALHAATLSEGSSIPIATSTTSRDAGDQYGHGTLIAGLIAGDGRTSGGRVVGVAPRANLVNVRVLDAQGEATISDVIRGMEWVYQNRERYNIRVLNVSLNSSLAESYEQSPLSAAVEILWINQIVVVVSAGNNGNNGTLYPPANDPFVITVGASDDRGTASTTDDVTASFSARGVTGAGTSKPEILAPGVSLLSLNCPACNLNRTYTANVATGFTNAGQYFRASGTSLSSALVSGAAALILQQSPWLTPDQVKYRLIATGRSAGSGQPPHLNIAAAALGTTTESANTGHPVNSLLFTGSEALSSDSARWGSARWGSARWGSARWGSMAMVSSLRSSVSSMSYRAR